MSLIGLLPIQHNSIQSKLMYHLHKIAGAVSEPFLAGAARDCLYEAANYLTTQFGPQYKFLVWDAYRTRETQQAIFDAYRLQIKQAHLEMNDGDLDTKTREFVNPPTGLFPHGCGGAVDLTLLIDGHEAEMGTEFDSFTAEAAANYYEHNEPKCPKDIQAKLNRRILQEAMRHAGFTSIESEWWHYEFGTKHWSQITGKPPILTTILTF